jgi:hypothetical protein
VAERSILEHVSAHVPDTGPGLRPEGLVLPDEPAGWTPSVPGERDALRILRGTVQIDEPLVEEVGDLLVAALASRKARAYDRLCERLQGTDALTYVEPLLGLVPAFRAAPERIYDVGRRLVTGGHHRAQVKVGIALFGFFEEGRHVDVVLTLGRHDEFTYYGAEAFGRGLDRPEERVGQLARNVTGWGRVMAVRTLAAVARRPEVLGWMLREGYRNDIADEYLALPVAAGGRLARELAGPTVDEALLDGAADLIRGLIRGGPLGGMDDYADGARATVLLVHLLKARASFVSDALALRDIDAFVCSPGDWTARAARGWTDELRWELSATCREILADPMWVEVVTEALASADDAEFRDAAELAALVGVDAVPALLGRLRAKAFDATAWFHVMAQVGEDRIDEALSIATARLPGAGVVAVSGHEPGPSRDVVAACLDVVLAGLVKWPGRGWPLVQVGLHSPAVRSRNLALRALDRWDGALWPPDARAELRALAEREPEPELRRYVERLLDRPPSDDVGGAGPEAALDPVLALEQDARDRAGE